ncbi:MarR family winged helix-turn-helix transcriptional regulator [Streptomyces axinellae]|uniref:MarR family winged helix-turn-helix transcriptional regulator n=1 Tax=Streptomyces axinellae TaxID=552788 RepID=UPI0031DE08D7
MPTGSSSRLFLNGRSAVGDIAKRTGLAQSRVSTSVRALAGRNWAITAADPSDGRKTLVDVTEPIRAAGQQRRAGRADKALTHALARADDTERAALIAALGRLHQLLVAGRTQRRFPDTVTP